MRVKIYKSRRWYSFVQLFALMTAKPKRDLKKFQNFFNCQDYHAAIHGEPKSIRHQSSAVALQLLAFIGEHLLLQQLPQARMGDNLQLEVS